MQPLIITNAVTGSANTPSMSPYLPLTPDEIADSAIEAARAGASIIHLHARVPETGRPSAEIDHYRPVLEKIKANCDAVISMTFPGGPAQAVEERLAVVREFAPEMAAIVPGSTNYSLYNRLELDIEWHQDWEKELYEASKDFVFVSTFADLEKICKGYNEQSIRPELEIFGLAMLYNVAHLVDQGQLDPPFHVEFVSGMLGAVRPEPEDLIFLKTKAEKLFGPDNITWSVSGMVGFGEFNLMPLAIQMGGHIRVGLEDNIHLTPGVLAKSNAEIVERHVRIAEDIGREIATPTQVREMLGLKGQDKVNF